MSYYCNSCGCRLLVVYNEWLYEPVIARRIRLLQPRDENVCLSCIILGVIDDTKQQLRRDFSFGFVANVYSPS